MQAVAHLALFTFIYLLIYFLLCPGCPREERIFMSEACLKDEALEKPSVCLQCKTVHDAQH